MFWNISRSLRSAAVVAIVVSASLSAQQAAARVGGPHGSPAAATAPAPAAAVAASVGGLCPAGACWRRIPVMPPQPAPPQPRYAACTIENPYCVTTDAF